jgi:serine/threonine protein phosphatase PrpC
VCDGHGACGKDVSGFVKANLPIYLNENIKEKSIFHSLKNSFTKCHKELPKQKFDS